MKGQTHDVIKYALLRMSGISERFEIKGFPDFEVLAAEGRLRLDKILEIRETRECREFRTWLKQIDRMSDEEIQDQIESFRSAVGNFMGRTSGKIRSSSSVQRTRNYSCSWTASWFGCLRRRQLFS